MLKASETKALIAQWRRSSKTFATTHLQRYFGKKALPPLLMISFASASRPTPTFLARTVPWNAGSTPI